MSESLTLSVRFANSSDAEQIADLHAASWQSAYKGMLTDDYLTNLALEDRLRVWHERFMPENQNRYNTLLACHNEILVGFICVILDADDAWGALIDNLHVHPDHIDSGIGRNLMQYAVAWITQQRQYSSLHLFVYEENNKACAFYNRLGGQVIERQLQLRADTANPNILCYMFGIIYR